jgi:hypothetical protein
MFLSASALLLAACASNPPVAPPVTVSTPAAQAEPAPSGVPVDPAAPVESASTASTNEASSLATAPLDPAAAAAAATASLPPSAAFDGSFTRYLNDLKAVSCPAGTVRTAPEAVTIETKKIALQQLNPSRRVVGDLTFVGGFHITGGDKRFGGLSGIDALDDGNLLAVSDVGDFVWIDLAKDGATPVSAKIASMRDVSGKTFGNKFDGDSEGLAVNGGMALVSFERNHRVLAYDLGACGAAARGAPLTIGGHSQKMPDAFTLARINVDENQGPEPLAVTSDWYLFTGIETKVGAESTLSARPIEAPFDFNLRIAENAPEFVGLDLIETGEPGRTNVRAFSLHRSFSPLSGNAITIYETDFKRKLDQSNLPRRVISDIDERAHYRFVESGRRKLAELNVLFNIDNFEGIAARQMSDGRIRLYLISDNNFAAAQRTLLYVFDVAKR